MRRKKSGLTNQKILITCGPTWVPIDDIRVISNQSTGELGQKLALIMTQKGSKVTLLEGPVKQPLQSKSIKVYKFQFFDEFARLLQKMARNNFDIIVHAAAVSDYQLEKPYHSKLRSNKKQLRLALKPTAKLIDKIKSWAPDSFLVGFKLESSAQKKILTAKAVELCRQAKCDLVIGNSVAKGYKGYIVDKHYSVLADAKSKNQIIAKLIKMLESEERQAE